MIAAVEAMDPEVRRQFIRDTNKNTPSSKVQLELRRQGLTVNQLRKWLNVTYRNGLSEAQR